MIETVEPHLPTDKPRYLMGVGTPDDLLQSVARGVDMFDCVMPTRAGRHGLVFTRFGRINLRNARHADDARPIDPQSSCAAARDYSRAYLRHLVKSGEILAMMALTAVNLAYYQESDGRHARRDRRGAARRFHRAKRRRAGRAAKGRARLLELPISTRRWVDASARAPQSKKAKLRSLAGLASFAPVLELRSRFPSHHRARRNYALLVKPVRRPVLPQTRHPRPQFWRRPPFPNAATLVEKMGNVTLISGASMQFFGASRVYSRGPRR